MMAHRALPLEGTRVVDFTTVYSGPLAGRLLADFGAEVIKLEGTGHPDRVRFQILPETRGVGPRPYDQGGYFHQFNRNKCSLALDLGQDEGRRVLKRLVAVSDVFLSNYTARVLANLKLEYRYLKESNPAIVAVSMTGYGVDSVYRDLPAFGPSVEAMAGFTRLVGYGDGVPVGATSPAADYVAAWYGLIAVLAGLYQRDRTGYGQFIDLSQLDGIVTLLGPALMEYILNGREPAQQGNRNPAMCPHSYYRCRGEDQWLGIAVAGDGEWKALCEAARSEWARDERFSDMPGRKENEDELDRLLERWTIQHDAHDLMQELQRRGVAAGAVLNGRDILQDTSLKQREFFWQVPCPDSGTNQFVGSIVKLSGTPARLRLPPPRLGEHNRYVLRDLLGMSDEEIQALEDKRVIGDTVRETTRP